MHIPTLFHSRAATVTLERSLMPLVRPMCYEEAALIWFFFFIIDQNWLQNLIRIHLSRSSFFQHNVFWFIHVLHVLIISFYYRIYSIIWLYHNLFIYSINRQLVWFQNLVIINKNAMNVLVQVFLWKHVFISLGKYLGEELLVKWRGTKKPLDESESGEWKSWLKDQHSEN